MNVYGQRLGALGLIFPDGVSFISGSSLDVNEGGTVQSNAAFSGTYTVDDTGHGTTTLSIPKFDGGIFDLSFYVVSANEFLVISVDTLSSNNPLFGGVAEAQTGTPFTTASFQGGSVFELSGNNGTAPDDTVGVLEFGQQDAVSAIYDENNGGAITITGGMQGTYDIEPNGRGTLNLVNEQDSSPLIWYFYATSPNSGFIMDASRVWCLSETLWHRSQMRDSPTRVFSARTILARMRTSSRRRRWMSGARALTVAATPQVLVR